MKRIVFVLWVLLLTLLPAAAQDDEAAELKFTVPEGFESEANPDGPGTLLTQDDVTILVLLPEDISAEFEEEFASTSDALVALMDLLYGDTVEAEDIETMEVSELYDEGSAWYYISGEGRTSIEGAAIVMHLSEGGYVFVDVYARELDEETESIALALFDTVSTSGEGGGFRLNLSGVDLSDVEPCFVSTDTARTVQIRVGPGENRTVIAFLPDGSDFTVLGKANDDADVLWYKLDKAEVDPGSGANEMWVRAEDVATAGPCDLVADAAAPVIIPITTTRSGDGGGEPVDELIPNEGIWQISLDRTTNASCVGGSNVSFDTQEVFELSSLSYYSDLFVQNGGRNLSFDDNIFEMTAPGSYIVSVSLEDGTNAQYYLTVQNRDFMVGRIIGNFSSDGLSCSFTVGLSARRR